MHRENAVRSPGCLADRLCIDGCPDFNRELDDLEPVRGRHLHQAVAEEARVGDDHLLSGFEQVADARIETERPRSRQDVGHLGGSDQTAQGVNAVLRKLVQTSP